MLAICDFKEKPPGTEKGVYDIGLRVLRPYLGIDEGA